MIDHQKSSLCFQQLWLMINELIIRQIFVIKLKGWLKTYSGLVVKIRTLIRLSNSVILNRGARGKNVEKHWSNF